VLLDADEAGDSTEGLSPQTGSVQKHSSKRHILDDDETGDEAEMPVSTVQSIEDGVE
jgi:hypothetical protein